MTQDLITPRMIYAALPDIAGENSLRTRLACALGLMTILNDPTPEQRIAEISTALKEIDAITYALIAERRALTPVEPPAETKRNPWILNRYVAERLLTWLDAPHGVLGSSWAVVDTDGPEGTGEPTSYGNEWSTLTLNRAEGGWVLCTDRGMYLRHPSRKDGRKGKVRVFKTPLDAAIAAEQEDGTGR